MVVATLKILAAAAGYRQMRSLLDQAVAVLRDQMEMVPLVATILLDLLALLAAVVPMVDRMAILLFLALTMARTAVIIA